MSRQKIRIDQLVVPGDTPDGYVPTVQAGELVYAAPGAVGGGATSLDGLTDVDTTTTPPAGGDRLTFDAGSGLWIPGAASPGGGAGVRPLSLPQGSLTRKYDFATDVTGWTATAGTVAWDSTEGRLKHTAGTTGATIIILEPSSAPSVADGEVVVDLSELIGTSGYADTGLFFRATDTNNFYMLALAMGSVAAASAELWKRVNGTWTNLGGGTGNSGGDPSVRWPVSGRQQMRMMVRFVGSHIRAYFNEVFLGAWNDSSLTSGRVGVRHLARNSTSQIAYFDNVAAYSLAANWRPPAYD